MRTLSAQICLDQPARLNDCRLPRGTVSLQYRRDHVALLVRIHQDRWLRHPSPPVAIVITRAVSPEKNRDGAARLHGKPRTRVLGPASRVPSVRTILDPYDIASRGVSASPCECEFSTSSSRESRPANTAPCDAEPTSSA